MALFNTLINLLTLGKGKFVAHVFVSYSMWCTYVVATSLHYPSQIELIRDFITIRAVQSRSNWSGIKKNNTMFIVEVHLASLQALHLNPQKQIIQINLTW